MKTHSTLCIQGLALVCAASVFSTACNKAPTEAHATTSTTSPVGTSVGTEIDDSVVTARVRSALIADHDVKSFEVKIETRKGQVQLGGFVDTQARIDTIVAIARKVEGVKGVENAMSVKSGKQTVGNVIDDSIITTQVKSALLTDSAVNSADIAVVTRKGEVQLSGYVTGQAQIARALALTQAVEGVHSVNNQMSIKK